MYRLVNLLIQPYPVLVVLLGVGVILLWWRRRESRKFLLALTGLYLVLYLLSSPVISFLALWSLERRYPPEPSTAHQRGGPAMIVVLAGGAWYADPKQTRVELGQDTLYRCMRATELYQEGPCPVVASGGRPEGMTGPLAAPYMVAFLRTLGVRSSDLVSEARSHTTSESAVEIRKMLDRDGPRRVILVTEAYHMERSVRCFRKEGVDVEPAPCHHLATTFRFEPAMLLPSPSAAQGCHIAFHEWVGMLWYKLRGRI